jgi:HTH-type transcriptional regulator, glycine betaine synthesis regulator
MSRIVHLSLNWINNLARNERVPHGIAQDKAAERTRLAASSKAWSGLEAEVIGLFVQLSRIIGQPRSYAEIYGVLFLSPQPMTMDELVERLGISKGSASQGLSFLRKAGAVRIVHLPGRRPACYEAVAELRHLAAGFLQDQILPQVEDSQNRLKQIVGMAARLPAKERAQASRKVTMLESWGKRTRQFLPLVVEMMGT